MDWANERYVRAYTRDTGDWLLWPWETRALLLFLFRKVDRSGLLHLGKGKLRALAAIVGMPEEEVAIALEPLLEDGCVQLRGDKLAIPNFMKAQETPQSDKLRKQESRERAREVALGQDGHTASRAVTPGHAESRLVTLSLAEPSQTEPSSAEPDTDTPAAPVREEPQSQTRIKSVPPPPPEPSADRVAIAFQIRSHAVFRPLDAHALAPVLEMRAETGKKKLAWVLQAIDDCAAKSVGLGMKPEALQEKLVGFCGHARPPKDEEPVQGEVKSGSAYVEDDDEETVERIRRMPKRVTAQDAAKAAAERKAGAG